MNLCFANSLTQHVCEQKVIARMYRVKLAPCPAVRRFFLQDVAQFSMTLILEGPFNGTRNFA